MTLFRSAGLARFGVRWREGSLAAAGLRRALHGRRDQDRRDDHRGVAAGAHQRGVRADARGQGDPLGDPLLTGPSRRSEEHTSELQSLMRISSAVFCLKKKKYIEHK